MSSRETILVVDDEPAYRSLLKFALGPKYEIYSAGSTLEARDILEKTLPSLILLDVYLSGESGFSLCKYLREKPATQNIPIIMITARNERQTRIDAFESGADDFLEKPFNLDELFSRIDSKLRRRELLGLSSEAFVTIGDLQIDIEGRRVMVAGQNMDLGQIEFKLLLFLARRTGILAKRDDLETLVWGSEKPVTRSLDTHMAALRKKLKSSSLMLSTAYGQGYVLQTVS